MSTKRAWSEAAHARACIHRALLPKLPLAGDSSLALSGALSAASYGAQLAREAKATLGERLAAHKGFAASTRAGTAQAGHEQARRCA